MPNAEIEIYEDSAGEWRWRMVAANSQIVADSGEGYTTKDGARQAAKRFQEQAAEATVEDTGDDGEVLRGV